LRALDPRGCGCTDCLVGYSLPLDCAGAEQIMAMLRDRLINRTSTTFRVTAECDSLESATSKDTVYQVTITPTWPSSGDHRPREWTLQCTRKRLDRISRNTAVTTLSRSHRRHED
jgi:hypothetical protein